MKRRVDVHTGEVMAGSEETVLHSDSHNRCMVICAYDQIKKIGGLTHAMFLSGRLHREFSSPILRDAGGAIDEMIDDMLLMGAEKKNIEICLVAGENIPHRPDDLEYNETLLKAVKVLENKHIKHGERIVADAGNLHVSFDVTTGNVSYD